MTNIDSVNIDSLTGIIKENKIAVEDLQKKLEKANDIIIHQNFFLENFGNIYTTITIILALAAIVVPIWVYYSSIKPSRRIMHDLEDIVNQKLANYLEEATKKRIMQALEFICDGNTATQIKGINILTLMVHEPLPDYTISRIGLIVINHPNHPLLKPLIDILVRQDSNLVSEILENLATRFGYERFIGDIYEYFLVHGYEDHKRVLVKSILLENPWQRLGKIIDILLRYSPIDTLKFCNDSLIDELEFLKQATTQESGFIKSKFVNYHLLPKFQVTRLHQQLKSESII